MSDILKQLKELPDKSIAELHELFNSLFGKNAPATSSKDYIIRRIAYRMQEIEFGELSSKLMSKIKQHGKDIDSGGSISQKDGLTPGTQIIRRYKDEDHHVKVRENGYEYKHCLYKSLTAVARQITGVSRNGWEFFDPKNIYRNTERKNGTRKN